MDATARPRTNIMERKKIYIVRHADDLLFAAESEELAEDLIAEEVLKNGDIEDDYEIEEIYIYTAREE